MQKLASLLARHPKFGKKCALLVNPDHVVRYGLARMLSTLAEFERIDLSIFFKRDDAGRFLKS
jgi:hypothetical protein